MDQSPLWRPRTPSASTACPSRPGCGAPLWLGSCAPPCLCLTHVGTRSTDEPGTLSVQARGVWTPISRKLGEWEPGTGSERPVTARCLVYAAGGRVRGSGLPPSFHRHRSCSAASSSPGTSSYLPRRAATSCNTVKVSTCWSGAADAGGLWTCCIQPSALQGVKPVSLWLGQLLLPAPSPCPVCLERSHPCSRVWEK